MIKKCIICDTNIIRKYPKPTQICCSRMCQGIYVGRKQREEYIKLWKLGKVSGLQEGGSCPNGRPKRYEISDRVRYYLYETRGRKCEECGWQEINQTTKESPVQIHHKDGNTKNASEKNLIILCPNCHSLTPTWQNLNKEKRKKF